MIKCGHRDRDTLGFLTRRCQLSLQKWWQAKFSWTSWLNDTPSLLMIYFSPVSADENAWRIDLTVVKLENQEFVKSAQTQKSSFLAPLKLFGYNKSNGQWPWLVTDFKYHRIVKFSLWKLYRSYWSEMPRLAFIIVVHFEVSSLRMGLFPEKKHECEYRNSWGWSETY